ncbi:haloacid dehalogenase [Bordetella pertussis]|nr:haloacid dehalogenase [Bordetella pertussis]
MNCLSGTTRARCCGRCVRTASWRFVAGSGHDLFGTAAVGLRTCWHNRLGLARPQGAPEPELQSATLAVALPWLQAFRPAVR